MLDFKAVSEKTMTLAELTANLTIAELRKLTNEMIDLQLSKIAHCTDSDVTFVPSDPAANDTFAAAGTEVNIPWTLGHVIVHITASSEEAAAIAAEMARGVVREGRSRYETPWESVGTIAQCRQRLEESRRMRLASLEVWPDQPHLDNTVEYPWLKGAIDARGRFALGLYHDDSHLGQIEDIVNQAKAARK